MIVFSRGARDDLERLRDFLASENPDAAGRAADALLHAVSTLNALPHRGRPAGILGLRELIVPFGGSAYLIRYFVAERRNAVVILRIWHGRETRK